MLWWFTTIKLEKDRFRNKNNKTEVDRIMRNERKKGVFIRSPSQEVTYGV